MSPITVTYINADNGGLADFITVAPNTTFEGFFALKKPGEQLSSYVIKVRRAGQPSFIAARDGLVMAGDRISIFASKHEGAR